MTDRPLNYIFVGGFQVTNADGSSGGQVVACRTLVESPISEHIKWSKIDTTMVSLPPPSGPKRAVLAARRLLKFGVSLAGSDGALIFTSARMSFVEKGLMALTAGALGKRVVLCPRSGLILDDIEHSAFMRWYIPFVLRRADVVVCQGESWRHRFEDLAGVSREHLLVAPNWLDVTPYEAIANQRVERGGPAKFLYLGWLERYKGIYDLLDAVALRCRELEGAEFIVCGQGTEEAGAKGRARELGIENFVRFHRWVSGEQKMRMLEEADVLVLPSHREGMPNALLEAMASGLAVIATTVGGIPDVLGPDKAFGISIPPRSPSALAEALLEMNEAAVGRHQMGTAGRRHVVENHDINVLWRRILAALQIEGPGPTDS